MLLWVTFFAILTRIETMANTRVCVVVGLGKEHPLRKRGKQKKSLPGGGIKTYQLFKVREVVIECKNSMS